MWVKSFDWSSPRTPLFHSSALSHHFSTQFSTSVFSPHSSVLCAIKSIDSWAKKPHNSSRISIQATDSFCKFSSTCAVDNSAMTGACGQRWHTTFQKRHFRTIEIWNLPSLSLSFLFNRTTLILKGLLQRLREIMSR